MECIDLSARLKKTASVGLASSYVERAVAVNGAWPSEEISRIEYYYLHQAEKYFKKAQGHSGAAGTLAPSLCSGLGYVYLKEKKFDLALHYLSCGLALYPREGAKKEYVDMNANMAEYHRLVLRQYDQVKER